MKADVLDAVPVGVGFDRDERGGVLRLEHVPAFVGEKEADGMALARAAHSGKDFA